MSDERNGATLLAAAVIASVLGSAGAPAQTQPVAPFDGRYVGSMAIAEDHASGQRGAFHGKLAPCAAGPFSKSLTIAGGRFSFYYSDPHNVTLTGNVAVDGSLSGSAPSSTGALMLTGRIAGNLLTGTVGGAYCKYALQLRRT